MKKLAFLFTLSLLFIYGCSTEEVMTTDSSNENLNEELTRGPIMHHVNVGGNDACEAWGLPPGCDENFSLSARMHADGSVNGQWQDTFAGDEGIHVAIDCLIVVDNTAVIGGYITEGISGGVDVSGQYAVTAVVDNGTSNNDTPDQISYSWFPFDNCSNYPIEVFDGFLFNMPRGQVKVR